MFKSKKIKLFLETQQLLFLLALFITVLEFMSTVIIYPNYFFRVVVNFTFLDVFTIFLVNTIVISFYFLIINYDS